MYEQSLVQAGLLEEQAQIYELLLKDGPMPAGKISKKTGQKRGLVYKNLERLANKGLIEKSESEAKVAIFTAMHPFKLKEWAQNKEKKARDAQLALSSVLPSLVSDYNMISGQPGIMYFEGEENLKNVVLDTLESGTEIYQYIDNEAVNKFMPKLNEEYVRKRKIKNIKKKMITIESEYIIKNKDKYDRQLTDIHLIDADKFPFATAMQIYGNKVSYITLNENKKIGIIIDDADIAKMHKTLFEFMWEKTKPLFENPTEIHDT